MKNRQEKHLKIPKIETGIVIDHIPAGKGLSIAKALGLDRREQEWLVLLGLNFESKKLGRKDLIKVVKRGLSTHELNMIAVIAPGCTVKRISNFSVEERVEIKPPDAVDGLLECLNPICVSNRQREIVSRFIKIGEKPLVLKCFYCERICEGNEIMLL